MLIRAENKNDQAFLGDLCAQVEQLVGQVALALGSVRPITCGTAYSIILSALFNRPRRLPLRYPARSLRLTAWNSSSPVP